MVPFVKFFVDLMWKVKEEKYDKPRDKELKKCRQTLRNQENRIKHLEDKNSQLREKWNESMQEGRHWRESFHNCSSELTALVRGRSVIEDVDYVFPNYPKVVE